MKIYQNQDLIVTSFIREKLFILNSSLVTSDIAFRAKLIKLTILTKLMSISANSSKLSKLARLTIKSAIEQESSTHNNKIIYN